MSVEDYVAQNPSDLSSFLFQGSENFNCNKKQILYRFLNYNKSYELIIGRILSNENSVTFHSEGFGELLLNVKNLKRTSYSRSIFRDLLDY